MARIFLGISGLSGGLAVVFGAFGSHALRYRLSSEALSAFETGVRYQMYHAIALLLVAVLIKLALSKKLLLTTAGYAFIAGTILFSGSLYLISALGLEALGIVTPIGGAALIIGWGCIAFSALAFK